MMNSNTNYELIYAEESLNPGYIVLWEPIEYLKAEKDIDVARVNRKER